MHASDYFNTVPRRLFIATALWVIFWPVFWFIKIGDISGVKSWFWIIGELNYPIAAMTFFYFDGMVGKAIETGWKIFLLSAVLVSAVMPFFYKWFGFKLAVLLEAVITGFINSLI